MTTNILREKVRELILGSLEGAYTASSCHKGIITGNHYQSVRLGEDRTKGFRSDRGGFLDEIDFRGRTVLDLGSNLGEMSREARERGAESVDGWEYDDYFIQIANLINAYNGSTRVSFSQADITDRTLYASEYDIVMAWSVWSYAGSVLPQIASITRELFVVETHKLDGNLERDYLEPIGRFFPRHVVLGESDWGSSLDPSGGRSVILFYKSDVTAAGSRPASARVTDDSAATLPGDVLDVQRTTVARRFFDRFCRGSAEELLSVISGESVDLPALSRHEGLRSNVYNSWEYWLLFVKGYLEFAAAESCTADNIYVRYLSEYYAPEGQDPGLARLVDPVVAMARASRRFADFAHFRSAQGGTVPDVAAIRVLGRAEPHLADDALVFTPRNEHPLRVRLIDGHHRIFSAAFFGRDVLPYRLEIERSDLTELALLRYTVTSSADGTFIEGQVAYPDAAQLIEVRRDGGVIGRGVLSSGDRRRFRARLTGARAGDRLELLALHDWLPAARTIVEIEVHAEAESDLQSASPVAEGQQVSEARHAPPPDVPPLPASWENT